MKKSLSAMILAIGVTSAAQAVTQYTMVDIGSLGGYTGGLAINAAGNVTGLGSIGPNAAFQHAFFYDGTLHDLGVAGGSSAAGYDINSSNVIAGATSPGYPPEARAFVYDGAIHHLGTLGGSVAEALGINDAGAITGYSTTASGAYHAFLYQNGVMQDLGAPGGGNYSIGQAINEDGHVVGYYSQGANRRAFLYDGSMHDLGTLGGGSAWADAISGGFIVGTSSLGPGLGSHAFLWNGTMQDLGTFGGRDSYGNSVNASGDVVGYAYDSSSQQLAFIHDGTGMFDLNTLVVGGISGFKLYGAEDINDVGQILVNGTNGHSYILTPVPVPAAAWLFGSALGGMLLAGRRKERAAR